MASERKGIRSGRIAALALLWPSLAFAGTIYDHSTPDWRASE